MCMLIQLMIEREKSYSPHASFLLSFPFFPIFIRYLSRDPHLLPLLLSTLFLFSLKDSKILCSHFLTPSYNVRGKYSFVLFFAFFFLFLFLLFFSFWQSANGRIKDRRMGGVIYRIMLTLKLVARNSND